MGIVGLFFRKNKKMSVMIISLDWSAIEIPKQVQVRSETNDLRTSDEGDLIYWQALCPAYLLGGWKSVEPPSLFQHKAVAFVGNVATSNLVASDVQD